MPATDANIKGVIHIDNPYQNLTDGQWLRGNLHTHTDHSDGQRPTQAVINDYARRGYNFLMISDHDFQTDTTDYAKLDANGMLLIPGNEITANGPHLLHVNADRRLEPDADRQAIINKIRATRGFAIINHPNWESRFDHCSSANLNAWQGYVGIEIYNGVINRHDGSPYATNKWDMLLAQGRRVWGFANDDSHSANGDVELGWNMVYTRRRSTAAIVEALRQGRFYASTGVVISQIEVTGRRIRIETQNAQRRGAMPSVRQPITSVSHRALEVEVPATASYVRFECWGSGESFAWTQPFFIRQAA